MILKMIVTPAPPVTASQLGPLILTVVWLASPYSQPSCSLGSHGISLLAHPHADVTSVGVRAGRVGRS